MGCSPSKGQLFSNKALPSAPQELLCDGNEKPPERSAETETKDSTATPGKRTVVCDAAVTAAEDSEVQRKSSHSEQIEGLLGNMKEGTEEIKRKDKQGQRRKQRKQKLRKTSYVQSKAEFILKAHQAAYAYLNPSISRYESLLELLDQAAQARLPLQTTVASVVTHYEDINQALEEMAAEGEQMLWEHGNYMTSPASQDCLPTASKPYKSNFPELPSELLQQMLLHSTLKMNSVGESVKCLGDSALQELADYFSSLSQLFEEKLLVKRAAEGRLKQVLTHVEAAALRKASPEDSALHSEDSGIGADNECQNGSERRYGSSSRSGEIVGTTSVCTLSSSPDQQLLNGNEEVTDNDDDDDDDDDDDEEAETEEVSARDEQLTDKIRGTICGSSEADSSNPLIQDALQIHDQVNRKTRRPKTADNSCKVKLKHCHLGGPKRSQSTECMCGKMEDSHHNEQQRTLKKKQTLEGFLTSKNVPGDLRGQARTKIRRHSSGEQNAGARCYGLQYGSKGPFRAIPPNSPPTFTPQPPGRNAVKRLINTFSQGVGGVSRLGPLDQRPMRIKSNKKCGLPLLTNRDALTTNGNINSIHPPEPRLADRPEHLDLDSLPPPPPEMLMDNSFERSVGLQSEERAHELQCRQQRASFQRETLAPNRTNMQQGSNSYLATRPVRQDALVCSCIEQDYNQAVELDSEREEEATFSQHFTKVTHLPAESTNSTGMANGSPRSSPSHQEFVDLNEDDAATLHPKFFPPTTPPVSRTRLPPSCPTVHHAVPSPPSTAFPPSRKWTPCTTPVTSGIHRWTMSEENDPPVSFTEARAVFCQDKQLVPHTWTSTCTSTLPRPWGEPAWRLSTARLQPSFMRCSPSGHRSSHSEQQQSFPNEKAQGQGSDVTALISVGTNIVSVLPEGNSSDQGGINSVLYTANLNTHSMLEGEEITD